MENYDVTAARLAGSRKSIDQVESAKSRRGPQWVSEKLLPRDRRCPRCRVTKIERRRWTVDGTIAVCRSCSRYARSARHWTPADVFVVDVVYKVDGKKIREEIIKKSLSSKEVASRCGWSPAKQSRIESGQVTELDGREARAVRDALGVSLEELGHHYYAVGLRKLRESLGVSPRDFARGCGWNLSKQRRIEGGSVAVNSVEAASIVQTARELS
ncbi:hypothetical protein [Caudoviricetes sp.]|nr:hypothetical protein [Caudoviricetes sp.]UOF82726.1 hypothetical protein [Caudoviricetes sp.]